ncbi:MAG: LamG domain-containing protein [Akkermansiaceae bacterium]
MFSKRSFGGLLAALSITVLPAARGQLAGMPLSEDYSSIWWAEGFPKVVEGAPWLRVIETGNYVIALNTETLEVPHFGRLGQKRWRDLPAGDLKLEISVAGETYQCKGSRGWSRHGGPRLVEAGRFFQRADVTDLIFESSAGEELSVVARLETVAWPDRLSFIFDAEPGVAPIEAGDQSFGKVGGGFGLDGSNDWVVPESAEIQEDSFTWSFQAFLPKDYRSATKANPWLICRGRNEWGKGNLGIMLQGNRAVATMNVGGGRENQATVNSGRLTTGKWTHFVLSFDGEVMRLFLDGKLAGETKVKGDGKIAKAPMVFGRRGDGSGDGYHLKGVIDEVAYYQGALSPREIVSKKATMNWSFRKDGVASEVRAKAVWKDARLSLFANTNSGAVQSSVGSGRQVVSFFGPEDSEGRLKVEVPGRPVVFEPEYFWHRVNLDQVKPIGKGNDVIEKIPFTLTNASESEQVARLMFEKTGRGFRGRLGSAITGVSAILCDENGEPTGIPIQLSKNWHNESAAGVYKGTWFHGITQVRVPAGKTLKFQVVIANAHWGGVAAASHAQLSLIGWGSNQRWEQSALGCWGESICYEPAQGQANCTITDVRPVMVSPMIGKSSWTWTHNVGGGDFFRVFDKSGKKLAHESVKITAHRQGPCLTEVEFAGRIGKGIEHSVTTSLARTDDLVRGCYRLRMDVKEQVEFSRFVVFQVGADTYNFTREGRVIFGNETGKVLGRKIEPGKMGYRMKPLLIDGQTPWVSLEQGKPANPQNDKGAWANRGIVVREWNARVGGKTVDCHFAEHGIVRGSSSYSTMDLVLPAGMTRLDPGDFVEVVVEYIVMPQNAGDYYGPNEFLKSALSTHGGAWQMIHREALRNHRIVVVDEGKVERTFPDVRVKSDNDRANVLLRGGLGYVPVTFTGLESHDGFVLKVNGEVVDQGVHGDDFWQTDYDDKTKTWSRTYNLPRDGRRRAEITLEPAPSVK